MASTTKFDEEGLPIPPQPKKRPVNDTVFDEEGLPIPPQFRKKKDVTGSPAPSDSSPKPTQTEQPVGTSGSDPKQVTANYKNNTITPKDLGGPAIPVGPPLEQISSALNNKGKNLSAWQNNSSDEYVKGLVDQKNNAANQLAQININAKNRMIYEANNPGEIAKLENSEKYFRGQIQKEYDARKQKVVPELLENLKSSLGVKDWIDTYNKPDQEIIGGFKVKSPLQWNTKTHKLTPASTEWVIKHVDDFLNKKGDSAINAQVSGDLDKKNRTYEDISRSVVDYLNTIPVQKKQKEYTDDFEKRHPELKDAFAANKEVNDYFSKDKIADLNARVNIDRDKAITATQDKYFGKNGLAFQNTEYVDIQHKYAQLVADGKMSDAVARKQIEAEIKQNPALKSLNDNYEAEIRKITEKTQKDFEGYMISGLKKDKPKFTIYPDGTIGLAGMDEDKYKNLIKRYEGGLNDIAIGMGMDSNEAWQKQANDKAKSVGAFLGSVGSSLNDLTGAFSKYWFNKTQWGQKNVQYYEAQDISSPSIEQSQVAASWNWKGIESLKDPNFWLSKIGSMVPVIAGGSAIGLATDGAGMPEYIGWLANAGLFTAQSGLSTYNQMLNTRDAEGNLLTEADASYYMSKEMSEDFLPNLMMMAVTSGTILRGKNIVKPTIAGAVRKGLLGAAEAQPFFTWQGYNDYAIAQEAQGKKTDFWDYMQSKDFKDNLINGMIVGGGLSLLHAPGQYMKSIDNWTNMIHSSEGEFKNLIPQNYALGQEMAGNGNYLRDALKLHIFNTDPEGLNEEGKRNLADLKNSLIYSTNLDRNIRQGNLDPKNIKDLYQAHNLALADQHDYLSEQAAKEGNKSLSGIYKNKAKDYRQQAEDAANDTAKYHYLINGTGDPIFLSDRSFKTLEQEGTIAKWQKDGTIQSVNKSDDPDFARRYKEFVTAKNESTVEGKDAIDHAKDLIEENKDNLGVYYAVAKDDPSAFLKKVADQVHGLNADGSKSDLPDAEKAAREQFGDDIVDLAKVLHPEEKSGNLEGQNAENEQGNKGQSDLERALPDTLSPAEKQGSLRGGEANAQATVLVGKIHSANEEARGRGEALPPRRLKAKEESELRGFAKENDLMLPYDFGTPHANGFEQDVYYTPDSETVTKVNPNTTHESWNDFFQRIAIHNTLFPDVAYTLKGFTDRDGILYAVLEQPHIEKGGDKLTSSEVKKELKRMGFRQVGGHEDDFTFKNDETGVVLKDLHGQNVIRGTDGKIHFIDPMIEKDIPSPKIQGGSDAEKVRGDTGQLPEVGKEIGAGVQESGGGNVQQGTETGAEAGNEKDKVISSPKTSTDAEKTKEAEGRKGDVLTSEEGPEKQSPMKENQEPAPPSPPPPVVGPTDGGLHPHDNEWVSIQKKDLSERIQKENAFTQTNRETVDKVIGRLSEDAAKNGRTWQAQAEFEVNALHNEFFNADGTIKQAFNPTVDQLALIGIRLMDINQEAAVNEFNEHDDQQTARTAYLENEKAKAERLLSFGEAGRAFQFRQSLLKMGINGDIQIKRKAISASVGIKIPENEEQFNQLSKSDKQKIKPIYDAFNKWKSEYEKENKARNTVDEKYSKEEFDKQIKAAVADALKQAKVSPKESKVTKESSKKLATSLRNFADKFEKFGRADLPEGTQKSGVGPDIQKLAADAMRWIADKIESGDFKIPELISEAIGRFKGEDTKEEDLTAVIKDGLKEAGIDDKTLNAKTNRESILAKMKEIAKNSDVKDITQKMVDRGMVRDYLHDIARRGETDPEKILGKGVSELNRAFPGLDAKTLRDAYLKEGRFTPDKSSDLKDQVKKAGQTFRDVTILQRDIEALEVGDQLYGADKEKKNTLISDYEKKLRDEKDKLIKERARAERDIKDAQRKADKLADYDKRISDLNNHQKVWDRVKKSKRVDKELAAKREELRKALIKSGVKLETGSATSRAAKEKVIEAHNERVKNLKGKISDLLNDDTVSEEDKKALRSVQSDLNKLGVKVDAGELDDKIKKAIAATSKVHTSNITSLLTGRKAEVLADLKNLSTQLKKDNNSALQDIQLDQLKSREIYRKEQAERQLASGDFEDAPKLSDHKKDEELLKLTRDRKGAEHDLAYQIDKYHKQNQGFWQRQITRLQRLQRANLISGIMTNGKVLVATVVKPVSDALVRRTIGSITTPIFRGLGLKGEREVLNTDASIRSFEDSFKGMTQRQAAEKRGTTEKALETATTNLQAANDQLKSLKGTPEYEKYKDNEYTKAVNDYQNAQYEWAAAALYDFISPNSWKERLQILKTGVSKFEESMGGYRGTTWADEKSKHAIGTAANKIIHTLEIFGRTHGAEKDISARQAFVEGFLKRASERIKAGEQLTPSKLEGIALQSYPDFLGGKFQNKNPVAEAIRWAEAKASEGGPLGKLFAFWLQSITPVLKVPLNIEAEGLFKYTAGLPVAIWKTFSEIGKALKANDLTVKDGIKDFNSTMDAIREHMKGLSAEKRDSIINYANKGIFGAAMALVAGSMAAKGNLVFGGAYQEGKKKRKFLNAETGEWEELNYGEMAIDGHKVGKFWSAVIMHLPPLMPAVMSATYIQKYKDERGDEKDEKEASEAAYDGLAEVVRTAWEESALRSLGDIEKSPTNIFNSFTTQMAAKNIAEYFDTDADGNLIERKGSNIWENILLRTGGRKFVPTKDEYEESRGDRQDEKTDKAQQYKEGDLYYEKNQK